MFQRFSDDGLAQSSFLIACDRTREAVVVDPRRDLDAYTSAAAQHGLTITRAIETHVHADFVSGAHELAALGAGVVAGPGADLEFPFHAVDDGEELRVGDIRLRVLHTPGHTPEHISILVREPDRAVRVLTGDTLFVGAVGRPDLLGADQARALAGQLYDSLVGTLLALPDEVEVHPGHGAGSLCGAGIGNAPYSTIGQERRHNPFLQHPDKASFIAAVLADLPDTPPYFPRMKIVNRRGPRVLGLGAGLPPARALSIADAQAQVARGAVIVDLRSDDAFGSGHPTGAINIGFGPRIGYWAGWVVPPETPIVLVAGDDGHVAEAVRQLLRVGFDTVAGYVDGGYDAWRAAGAPVAQIEQSTARHLHDRVERGEPVTIVDVRTPQEWAQGHADGAINIPVGELPAQAGSLRGSGTVATMCETGYRSSLASSLLRRAGVDVINVHDGMAAYRDVLGARS